MNVLGYWLVCTDWLQGQGDMDAGVPEWQHLGEGGPQEERQPQACRDGGRWLSWGSAVWLGIPVWHISSKVSTGRVSATEMRELPL